MTGFWAWFHDGWEIIGSLGSAFAAGVAVWLASRERVDRQSAEEDRDEARRAQRAAERREERRERERQARQIAVWIDSREAPVWRSLPGGGAEPCTEYILNIANYSLHPVFDVGPGHFVQTELGVFQPMGLEPRVPILHPEEKRQFNLGEGYPTGGKERPLWFFRDLVGVMWVRESTGVLNPEELQPLALESFARDDQS